jgi:3'(2'), 5'-bisphosphate nucleotidase
MTIDIQQIIDIARSAGEAILEYYTETIEVDRKSDDSPLTKADLAAHQVIMKGLGELTPDIPVISEEGGIAGYEDRKEWKTFWLVDPLDGTKEFIKKNGEFTVNIALIEKDKPVLGVVYIPAQEIGYTGKRGKGSFKIERDGSIKQIFSEKPDLNKPVKVVSSRSHGSDDLEEQLLQKGITVGEKVPAGSSLKFCMVAEGRADIYPRMGPTMEWDTAAGDAVYRYSGKKGERMSPLVYNKKSLKNEGFIIGL